MLQTLLLDRPCCSSSGHSSASQRSILFIDSPAPEEQDRRDGKFRAVKTPLGGMRRRLLPRGSTGRNRNAE